MPSLDQFAERIIDLVHTRDPGSASIAVMTADAYLVAFEASQIDTERARLIAVPEDKGPWTEAMVGVTQPPVPFFLAPPEGAGGTPRPAIRPTLR